MKVFQPVRRKQDFGAGFFDEKLAEANHIDQLKLNVKKLLGISKLLSGFS